MVKKEGVEGTDECDKLCKGVEVPSEDEVVALNAMRRIKDRVRDLKKRLSEINSGDTDGNNEERAALEKEMAYLKAEWNEWEEKRKKAARERMILLGHEEGPL